MKDTMGRTSPCLGLIFGLLLAASLLADALVRERRLRERHRRLAALRHLHAEDLLRDEQRQLHEVLLLGREPGLALLLGGVFIGYAYRLWRDYSDALARRTFRYSILYLSLLFSALLIDHYLSPWLF